MGEKQARPIVLGLPKAKMKMLPLLDLNLWHVGKYGAACQLDYVTFYKMLMASKFMYILAPQAGALWAWARDRSGEKYVMKVE